MGWWCGGVWDGWSGGRCVCSGGFCGWKGVRENNGDDGGGDALHVARIF